MRSTSSIHAATAPVRKTTGSSVLRGQCASVVSTTVAPSVSSPAMLQRQCACGQHTVAGQKCEECKGKQDLLQRHSAGSMAPKGVPSIVHDVLRSPGQPLDRETRAFMEPRFGQDFSAVRVHTDANAVESAHAVNALAYTVG